MRSPTTRNWDVTFFKNFKISESKKLQFRLGFFNVFNEAFANPDLGDIAGQSGSTLSLNTLNNYDPQYVGNVCYQIPIGTPNGTGTVPANGNPVPLRSGGSVAVSGICDPTKGFFVDPNSINSFGKVLNKHGHRRVELALKFYF
jgi:hypothetical protein